MTSPKITISARNVEVPTTPNDFKHLKIDNGILEIPGQGKYRVTVSDSKGPISAGQLPPDILKDILKIIEDALKRPELQGKKLGDHVRIKEDDQGIAVDTDKDKHIVKADKNDQLRIKYAEVTERAFQALQVLPRPTPERKPSQTESLEPTLVVTKDKDDAHKTSSAERLKGTDAIWRDPKLLTLLVTYQNNLQPLSDEVNVWLNRPNINSIEGVIEFNEANIADMLYMPGNEDLFKVLVALGEGEIPNHIMELVNDIRVWDPNPNSSSKSVEGFTHAQLEEMRKGQELEKKADKYGVKGSVKFFILSQIERIQRIMVIEESFDTVDEDGEMQTEYRDLCVQAQMFARFGSSKIANKMGNEVITQADLDETIVQNKGFSSEFDKKTPPEMVGHCGNLAAVVTKTGANSTISCIRSGRPTDIARLKENVFFGCLLNFKNGQKGFVPTGEDQYEYQHMISSLMDFSSLKSFLVNHNPNIKKEDQVVENEELLLQQVMKALSEWPAGGIPVQVEQNGKVITVLLKKPIFAQQMFAGTLKLPFGSGREESLKANWTGNLQIFSRYFSSETLDDLRTKDGTFMLVEGQLKKGRTDPGIPIESLPPDKELKESIITILRTKIQVASDDDDMEAYNELISLYAIVTGKVYDPGAQKVKGKYPEKDVHALDMQLYRKIVCGSERGNIAIAIHCKSGVDRTGLCTAAFSAMDAYKAKYGKTFYPHAATEVELENYRLLFFEALKGFAFPVTTDSKGEWGISWEKGKWVGNPVAFKYLPKQYIKGWKVGQPHPFNPNELYKLDYANAQTAASILGGSQTGNRKARDKEFRKSSELRKCVQEDLEKVGVVVNSGLNPKAHLTDPKIIEKLGELEAGKLVPETLQQRLDQWNDQYRASARGNMLALQGDDEVRIGYQLDGVNFVAFLGETDPNPGDALHPVPKKMTAGRFQTMLEYIEKISIPGERLLGKEAYESLLGLLQERVFLQRTAKKLLHLHGQQQEFLRLQSRAVTV